MSNRSRKLTNQTRKSNHPKIKWAWPVGVGVAGMAVVLTCIVVQMQTHLETVQSELRNLEQTTTGLRQSLQDSDFKRTRLQGQLELANSKVEELSKAVDTSKSGNEKSHARLESMQSQLERAIESAKLARAEIAESEKQVASLSAKLDEVYKERRALQTELKKGRSEGQLKGERNAAEAKGAKDESSLGRDRSTLKMSTGKPDPSKVEKESGTDGLGKSSLDATSPEPDHAVLGPGPDGRDYLIRTLVFEASGETEMGKVAVAHVILNRKKSGRWGQEIEDVVTAPWQFEPWMTRKSEIERLSRNDPRYTKAAGIADAVLAGLVPDPTAGATHFLNPVIVRNRRGGSLPSWAENDGQPIGRHVFYCPECDGTKPTQAAEVDIWKSAGVGSKG
jgi:spore germination cell wall hydrolase CwlJ-like protein